MAENSSIEWCDGTFNPVRGCTKVSEGCRHCYAARDAARFPGIRGVWGDAGTRIVAVPDYWKGPERWNRQAAAAGVRRRVFCASLADVFEDWKGELRFPTHYTEAGYVRARWNGRQLVREYERSAEDQGLRLATMDDLRTELFQLMEATPALDWLLLTKRPQNVMRMVPEHWRTGFPRNIWMGTTVENQEMANKRIPELLRIPAVVHFLSCEPLLGRIDFRDVPGLNKCGSPGRELIRNLWVICGGESGPQARPMHPDWARSLRSQCSNAGVPFFFKQWGEFREVDDGGNGETHTLVETAEHAQAVLESVAHPHWITADGKHYTRIEDLPEEVPCRLLDRLGKRAAGRLLDGVEYSAFPVTGGAS